MKKNHQALCTRLHYSFTNETYLKQALTHRSAAEINNERLEFLGDSILNMVISQALFIQYPQFCEGELSRLRASFVKGDMLAELAQELNLGDHLYLGQGELKSGGFRRASILADALEAVFAAIYLDSGVEACQRVILELYQSRLSQVQRHDTHKDPKTTLQEFLQQRKITLPRYHLENILGEEHDQCFVVTCRVDHRFTEGRGETRRKAEQQSAQHMLDLLNQPDALSKI